MTKKKAFTLAEGATHVDICNNTRRTAFTLAEVLITLAIIGVVAAMTIPTLIANYQDKAFETASTTFQRKLGEALKVMNVNSNLAGFQTTESFVEELSKHIKITKTCSNDKLTDCFAEEVFWGTESEAVDTTTIKKAKNFGQKTWQETNVVGVQFADGTSALIAYNKDTVQDPYSNQIVTITGSTDGKKGSVSLGTTALAILYDTNGYKSPNKSSKDLRSINVTKLGKDCFAKIGSLCLASSPFAVPEPMTNEECTLTKSKLGISWCNMSSSGTSYWAAAVKACGGVSKMPNSAQLAEIANFVYDTNIIGANTSNGIDYDDEFISYNYSKASALGLPNPEFTLWSSDNINSTARKHRMFSDYFTESSMSNHSDSSVLVLCLGD